MEQYMDDYESYKRFTTPKCMCGCIQHCNDTCDNCDFCKECECEECLNGRGYN